MNLRTALAVGTLAAGLLLAAGTPVEATPYLVGSSLTTRSWRDVDVRVMLDDDHYDALTALVVPSQIDLAVSVWGQKVTGLPPYIDHGDDPRDPRGLPAFDPEVLEEVRRFHENNGREKR